MLLYLVRHAWAGQAGDPDYPDDALRPLTKPGRKRFRKFLKRLGRDALRPEVIATSPLVRCVETGNLLAHEQSSDVGVVELDALAPGARLDELLAWTAGRAESAVAWVGHAPDVGLLTAALVGDESAQIDFAKGAVACVEFDGPPARGAGTLAWLVAPRALGR